MKHIFSVLALILGAGSFSSCTLNSSSQSAEKEQITNPTHWQTNNLKGKVKTIKKTVYATNSTNGRLGVNEYDEDEDPIHIVQYNTDGYITSEIYYNAKEEWTREIKNTYDQQHRLVEQQTLYKDDPNPYYEKNTYDAQGNLQQVILHNLDKTTDTISYQYQQLTDGKKVTQLNDFYKSFSKIERLYNKQGLLTQETAYNGQHKEEETLFTYNEKGQCTREKTYYNYDKEQYIQSDYTYDKYGNVLEIKTSGNNTAMDYYAEKHQYTYDEQGNIVKDVLQDSDTQRTVIYEITYYQ